MPEIARMARLFRACCSSIDNCLTLSLSRDSNNLASDMKAGRSSRLFGLLATCLMIFVTGCFDFSGDLTRQREEAKTKKSSLETEVKAARKLFDERERVRQSVYQTENELEQIRVFIHQRKGEK